MNQIQGELLIMGLELEIKTWNRGGVKGSRMQLTQESSLHAFTRLIGINPGRGIKGRENAIKMIKEALADVGALEEVSA